MASIIQGSVRTRRFCFLFNVRAAPTLIPAATMTRVTSNLNNEFVIRHSAKSTSTNQPKTLVLMYGFYGATEKALQKYSSIYYGYGFDVLPIRSYLKHFAWPKYSIKLADQTLSYLQENCLHYESYLVHAFSMGAYNYTVCMATMCEKPDMYCKIKNKICGVIYDSLAIGSLDGMIEGIAAGISSNKLVHLSIPLTMSMYYYLTHRHTVAVYDYYLDIAKKAQLDIPILVFYCKNDLLSRYDVIDSCIEEWKRTHSTPVEKKLWDKSKHAAHLLVHETEYLQALNRFIKSVPSLARNMRHPQKSRL